MASAITYKSLYNTTVINVPQYLCVLVTLRTRITPRPQRRCVRFLKNYHNQLHNQLATRPKSGVPTHSQLLDLPQCCPGCGALTQVLNPDQPGYYSTNRKLVKAFLANHGQASDKRFLRDPSTFHRILDSADEPLLLQLGLKDFRSQEEDEGQSSQIAKASTIPICNRCHNLTHHRSAVPITHPTVRSIQHIISESPYKYNHIYHILDAADFPLSLIPSLHRHLSLAPPRSLNRRAKTTHFQNGRSAELSFIITRSDLLAPRKEQVDSLMSYLVQVLRDALAGSAQNVRLGNVRCVSSKRGWWTKQVKEDVWARGGGGWMVGKVNVGKSNLFEIVYPKGHNEDVNSNAPRHTYHGRQQSRIIEDALTVSPTARTTSRSKEHLQVGSEVVSTDLLGDSLLPPVPSEIPYPVLPLVSSLPGTTAAPIRVPFGGGRGELIDLPGLSRGNLEDFVISDSKLDLVMHQRIKPGQFTIKPGQSLLVGGLVRITPTTPDVIILAYPFVPLKCHVTSTDRAIAIHTQKEASGLPSIVKPGTGSRMDPAGSYSLKWDVTKQHAGPLIRKEAAGLNADLLPFIVLSTDILIEGCGWIELVAQVRKRSMEESVQPGDLFDARPFPRVEVFSPDGKYIGVRQPMGASLLSREKPGSMSKRIGRPRRSMKGVKKELKKARREQS